MARPALVQLAFIAFAVVFALAIVAMVVDVWVPVVTVSAEALQSVSDSLAESGSGADAGNP